MLSLLRPLYPVYSGLGLVELSAAAVPKWALAASWCCSSLRPWEGLHSGGGANLCLVRRMGLQSQLGSITNHYVCLLWSRCFFYVVGVCWISIHLFCVSFQSWCKAKKQNPVVLMSYADCYPYHYFTFFFNSYPVTFSFYSAFYQRSLSLFKISTPYWEKVGDCRFKEWTKMAERVHYNLHTYKYTKDSRSKKTSVWLLPFKLSQQNQKHTSSSTDDNGHNVSVYG